jgi:Domain of unknown function (DUF4112)
MFKAKTQLDVHNGKKAIERIARVSDNLIGIGPFGIGLDGILAWAPGLGEVYSIGAGAVLVLEGYRARVPASVLVQAGMLVSIRTLANIFPVLGGVIVDLFRGHRMAARLLVQAIDDTLYIEGVPGRDHPEYAGVLARIRSGEERRRVVFLG